MRLLFPIFLILLFVGGLPVFAQDNNALPGQAVPDISIDEQLGLTKPQEKRKSTGNLKRDYALKYYDECIQRQHPYISKVGRELLCGCTSQKIESDMPYNDIVAMFTDEAKAPDIHRKLLKTAYAECSRHPVNEMVKKDCIGMNTLKKIGKPRTKLVCSCLSDTMSRFMTVHGSNIIGRTLSNNPNDLDPLGTYLESIFFRQSYDSYLNRCIDIHVFGYK